MVVRDIPVARLTETTPPLPADRASAAGYYSPGNDS